jgi:hypothetical protein
MGIARCNRDLTCQLHDLILTLTIGVILGTILPPVVEISIIFTDLEMEPRVDIRISPDSAGESDQVTALCGVGQSSGSFALIVSPTMPLPVSAEPPVNETGTPFYDSNFAAPPDIHLHQDSVLIF